MVLKVKDFSIKLSFLFFCRVCGDNVLGFYYGVNMCEVCKVSVGCREWLYIYMKMKSLNDFFLNDFIKIIKKIMKIKRLVFFIVIIFVYDFNLFMRLLLW